MKVGSKFKRFGSDGSGLKVALARWALGPINSHKLGLGSQLNQIQNQHLHSVRFSSVPVISVLTIIDKMKKYKSNQTGSIGPNLLVRAGSIGR